MKITQPQQGLFGIGTSGPAGGDLGGTLPGPTVAGIQGVPVSATAPTNGQQFVYNSGTGQWVPTSVAATPTMLGLDGEDGADSVNPGPIGPIGLTGAGTTGAQGPAALHGYDGLDGEDSYIPGPPGPSGGRGEYAFKYNPDNETPATTPASVEEFNTTSGMTWSAAPGTIDDISGYPGFYRFKGDTTTRWLTKAWTPGATDVTVAMKFAFAAGTTDAGSIGIGLGATTGTPTEAVLTIFEANSGATNLLDLYNLAAGALAFVGNVIMSGYTRRGAMYLRLTRVNSGPTWTAYASTDGVTWLPVAATGSKALTVGSIVVRTDTNSDFSIDWIRAWSSVVAKVGA